jgi:hypothetical protein
MGIAESYQLSAFRYRPTAFSYQLSIFCRMDSEKAGAQGLRSATPTPGFALSFSASLRHSWSSSLKSL